jgi:hypothetical protein
MKAKTYKSTNNFTAPQSLSDFGIEVTNKKDRKYLGLEEFNFCPILQNFTYENGKHVAYVPCFSSRRQSFLETLDLFYLDTPGITIHYATLYNVTQIQTEKVTTLRDALLNSGLVDHVENSQAFQNNYENLFEPALSIWKRNFQSNNIVATRGIDRFVVNVFYEKIEFHKASNIKNWSNLKHASVLFK